MSPKDLQQDDLIYYIDESGKKDNLGLVIETLKDGCTIANSNGNEFKIKSENIYGIPINEEILSKISDLEKIDRFYYKGPGYNGKYIYKLDCEDYGPWFVKIFVQDEEDIISTQYKHDKVLINCKYIGTLYYVHELQHFENLIGAEFGMFEIQNKLHGYGFKYDNGLCKIYICDGLCEKEDYELWKKET